MSGLQEPLASLDENSGGARSEQDAVTDENSGGARSEQDAVTDENSGGARSEQDAVINVDDVSLYPRPPGPPHQVLASGSYLEMFLFHPDFAPYRAKDHACYELVCRSWAAFESSTWDDNFAPKLAYQWYYQMKWALPEIITLKADQTRERTQAKQKREQSRDEILGLHYSKFMPIAFAVWWLCCFVGFLLIGNYEDKGQVHDASPYVVAMPFFMGPLIFLLIAFRLVLRDSTSTEAGIKQTNQDRREIEQRLEDAVGGNLTLPTISFNKLQRSTSAAPKHAAAFFVTSHSADSQLDTIQVNMTRTAGYDRDPDTTRTRGLFPQPPEEWDGSGPHAPPPPTRPMRPRAPLHHAPRAPAREHHKGWVRESVWLPIMVFATLSLPAITAVLFAAGTSAVVAFIPLMIATCVPTLMVPIVYVMTSGGNDDTGLGLVVGCWVLCPISSFLVTLCVVYPLLLDGSIPNSSTSDWAAALSPLWFLVFVLLFGGTTVMTITTCRKEHANADIKQIRIVCCIGMLLMVASFFFGLVALILKASGGWDGMSYAAIICIVGGSSTGFGILAFVWDTLRR